MRRLGSFTIGLTGVPGSPPVWPRRRKIAVPPARRLGFRTLTSRFVTPSTMQIKPTVAAERNASALIRWSRASTVVDGGAFSRPFS